MKKFGLLIVGGIAAITLLANAAPLIGLALSLGFLYVAYKQFLKAESKSGKIFWVILGLVAISISLAHFPSVIGLVAAYVLYLVYKNWNKKTHTIETEEDPFVNFERQWAELKK
ncbi:flagellar basal body rod protein [Peribacillus sp. SCS-155]|uniref:lmo0954 family membrane protein n=1 Tax=Peribacillus sedimenti TaxID=3115297 RepID=UPI0039062DF1